MQYHMKPFEVTGREEHITCWYERKGITSEKVLERMVDLYQNLRDNSLDRYTSEDRVVSEKRSREKKRHMWDQKCYDLLESE